MVTQITTSRISSNLSTDRIPPYLYPDSEDRDRVIAFAITGYDKRTITQLDLSLQVRHGGRYFLGQIQNQSTGWVVTAVQRDPVNADVIHESVSAAAIACHEAYLELKRAARRAELR
jgi:hypothetical protein